MYDYLHRFYCVDPGEGTSIVKQPVMQRYNRIYVAGHTGLLGSAILRHLYSCEATPIIRTHTQLNLMRTSDVREFFGHERPQYVFLCAARVGGILANSTHPVEFLHDNLAIQMNVMDAAYKSGVRKMIFFGSSCIYPKLAKQPITEDALLSGKLEPTNEAYAVAKIAGVKLAQAYRKQYGFDILTLMPCNLYGPGDNFDLESSHVLAALIRKMHEAKLSNTPSVQLWGTGKSRREFLHADDVANAAVIAMCKSEDCDIINVGTGQDWTIRQLAYKVRKIVGYKGEIEFDSSKPDGTPRKLLDSSRMRRLGWEPKISLERGIQQTYQWYLDHAAEETAA